MSALLIYFGLWVARFHRKHEQEIEYSGSSSRLNAFPKPRKFAVALPVFEGVVMVVCGLFSFLMIFGHQTNLYDDARWFQAFPFFWFGRMAMFGFINSMHEIFDHQRDHREP